MKTFAIVLALCVSFVIVSPVCDSPFLVCDPQDGVTEYKVTLNGDPEITVPAQPDGSLSYDLAGLSEGAFTFSVKAANLWGVSDPSPFSSVKVLPQSPTSMRLSP